MSFVLEAQKPEYWSNVLNYEDRVENTSHKRNANIASMPWGHHAAEALLFACAYTMPGRETSHLDFNI